MDTLRACETYAKLKPLSTQLVVLTGFVGEIVNTLKLSGNFQSHTRTGGPPVRGVAGGTGPTVGCADLAQQL